MSWPVLPLGLLGSQASTAATDNDTYQISKSLRFNSADSAYLNRTPASAGNRKTWTWSGWVKRNKTSQNDVLFDASNNASTTMYVIRITSANDLEIAGYASGYNYQIVSTQLFKDPSAWYHVVVAFDTTQLTASNRIKLYINGSQVTSLSASSYPTQDYAGGLINDTVQHRIGSAQFASQMSDEYLAEVNFIDGQALTPSSFGETDAVTGRWKAKAFAGTYGTNGFYLPFSDNSGVTATTIGKDNSTYRMLTAQLNGTTNGIQRGADLTGIANGKSGTVSMWCNFTSGSSGNQSLWTSRDNTTLGTTLNTSRDTDGKIRISAMSSAGATILASQTTANVAATAGVYHIYISWDLTVNNQVKIYVNGVDQALTISTFTNATIQYSVPNHGFGGNLFGPFSPTTPVMLGQLYVNYSTYLDPDTNISKFYNAGNPVSLGTSGQIPTGSSPIVYLDGDATSILTNRGTGGNFAAYGTLATGTTYQGVGSHYNNWTPNNFSVTAGTGNDSLTDSPSNYGTISTTLVNDTYQISKSLRFNSADSAYLNRTPSVAGNRKTWTWSGWVKRSSSAYQQIFGSYIGSGTTDTNYFEISFFNDKINLTGYLTTYLISTAVYRDFSAWYHIVVATDTTTATADNRLKIYVNGAEITSFSTRNNPTPQSVDLGINAAYGHYLGGVQGNAYYLSAYLAEVNFIDGQALTPTSFGTRDINTYLWKPKAYTGTYGTNGFYLPFSDSSSTTTRNLLTYSEDFANGSWTNYQSTETSNAAVAPNGTTTADKLIPDAGALGGQFYRNYSAVDNTTYTFSVYAKAAEYAQLRLFIQKKATSATYDFADYDLTSATVSAHYGSPTSTSIVAVGNGWYRISISSNVGTGGTATPSINIQHLGSAGNGSNGILLWGAQLEDSGTLGPYLRTDASATASTLRLGSDSSVSTGGYNSWFANNFSVSAGPGNDSLVDSPTYYGTDTGVGGEARGDYATINPIVVNSATLTNGNLDATGVGTGSWRNAISTIGFTSGKYYYETRVNASNQNYFMLFGVGAIDRLSTATLSSSSTGYPGYTTDSWSVQFNVSGATYKINGTPTAITNTTLAVGDIVMVAFDVSSGKFWAGKNGTWLESGNPATGANPLYSNLSGTIAPFLGLYQSTESVSLNFGQRPFIHAAPSGFRALRDYNKLPTPTGGEVRGNYATLNPLFGNIGGIITDGNLTLTHTGGANNKNALGVSSIAMSTGKWYCEFTNTAASNPFRIGIISSANTSIVTSGNPYFSQYSDGYSAFVGGGTFKENNNTASAITNFGGSSPVVNDVYMVAVDLDSNKVWFGRNGSWANSVNPATGTTEAYSILSGRSYYFACNTYSGDQAVANFGQRPWAYDAPFGFLPLCTTLLPQPIVQKPSSYMDVVTYTGNSATQTISSLGFSPDLVWLKRRNLADSNGLFDSVRGAGRRIQSNDTTAEVLRTDVFTSFNTNGFSITGSDTQSNVSGSTYVAWAWDESPIAGLDIVSYVGDGNSGRAISHGLGVAPKFILVKNRTIVSDWPVYHASLPASNLVFLHLTNATAAISAMAWGAVSSTSSSTFTVIAGNTDIRNVNKVSDNYIAYCFAEVEGFSKFGSYTGNGSADGPFVYCGFRPRWVMYKRTDTTGPWVQYDVSRNTFNTTDTRLSPNTADAEVAASSSRSIDILSNGFKLTGASTDANASGGTYIFAAFAETAFRYARAR